jgi:hypothetical protein
MKGRKSKWIGHILCRNCLLNHVVEGKIEGRIEVRERRGIRRKQLPNDLKEQSGPLKWKEEALNRTVWRTDFERNYGPVVRQIIQRVRKRLYPFLIFFSRCPVCGEWCKLH